MISSITGTVTVSAPGRCVIDVNGVGYLVSVTDQLSRSLAVGDVVTVYTSLIVREDSMALFGFGTTDEQEFFDALISVSGVGPRSALGILSQLSPSQIATAVAADDDSPFRKVSGIGPKTAKLITVQLSGRVSQLVRPDNSVNVTPSAQSQELVELVVAALMQLGWNERRAREVLATCEPFSDNESTETLLKKALAQLGGRS